MALHNEGVIEHSGQNKELDAGAIDMLMDNLQISQYVYPVKSTIRELASNARDAITEKLNAIAILSGKAEVSDFYYVPGKDKKLDAAIKANPGVYKNSTFDPDYYWIKTLSDNNRVEITYKQNDTKAKDTLTVKDWGVGIGDYRLHGYLKLGWSSKRLMAKPLGKFGLGAKVPLAMAPYYQMNTVHNGRKFSIMVYSRHWDSIIPEKNLTSGKDNNFILLYNDDGSVVTDSNGIPRKIYFEYTLGQNYAETIVECKKHHLAEVTNAVQSQLLYFDNVDFTVITADGLKQQVEVMSPKLYEDEGLIVSDNKFFSKPHIVINNVNYGYINTDELEIEPMRGNIGIKVEADEVDVTPNRENVIWNDTAVKVILKRVKQSARAAKKLILESFQQTDFMEWLGACAGVFGYGDEMDETTVSVKALIQLQHIARVRQKEAPSFAPDPNVHYIGYIPQMFPGLKVRKVTSHTFKGKVKAEREEETSVRTLFTMPVFTYETVPTQQKDLFLLQQYPNGFILIQKGDGYFHEEIKEAKKPEKESTKEFIEQLKARDLKNDPKVVNPLLLAAYPRYEDVEVPKEFGVKPKDDVLTPEQIRKAEHRIVIQTPDSRHMWLKAQPKVGDLATIDKELYWGNNDDRDGLMLAAVITPKSFLRTSDDGSEVNKRAELLGVDMSGTKHWRSERMTHWFYPNTSIMLALVSQENAHYLAGDHYHISEFYNRYEDGVLTMAGELIKWNTGRIMFDRMGQKLLFLAGMKQFDLARYEEYKFLRAYASKYYNSIGSGSLEVAIVEHLDKVTKLQEFIADDPEDQDGIYEVSQALFGADIGAARAVDIDMINRLQALLDWSIPIRDMLNMVDHITHVMVHRSYPEDYPYTTEQFDAIADYVHQKTGE